MLVNAQKDAVLSATTDGLADERVALLTAATDLSDPSTWTEASYSGYARVAIPGWNAIGNGSTGVRQRTWPTTDMLFAAIPSGTVTVVADAICDGTGSLATAAKRVVDTAYSQAYTAGQQPKIAAGAKTASQK